MALAFVSEDSEGVLVCKADDEGTTPELAERGKPPDANRARVGDGEEVEALRGERDRGTVTLLGYGVGDVSCLGAEVVRWRRVGGAVAIAFAFARLAAMAAATLDFFEPPGVEGKGT